MKTCPECQNPVSRKAKTCPHCGRPKPKTLRKMLIIALVATGVLFAVSLSENTALPVSPPAEKEINPEDYVITMSWEFVKGNLKSPSTAKFGRIGDHEVYKIEGMENAFEVRGHVDSQNSFGAMIGAPFVCRLQYVGDESWRMISLDFY